MGQAPTAGTDMPRDRDDESGQYVESYPAEEFVAALQDLGGASTREVAEHVGCVYTTAYHKLRELEDEGRVTSRKVANARLWQPADDGVE